MMRKRMIKNVTFYFVATVFLACYLAETAECYRRRKPLRIDVHKEVDSTEPVGVQEGEILFGKSLKEPESQLMGGTNQPSSNTSVEDETGFQADYPGLPYNHAHMDAWNQMTKSLQCGEDHMHLKVLGSGVQHFGVDQLNGPSLPLPLVPPSCGYNIRRLPFFLRLSIPYSGCNILNRGGYYMLPLTWRGIPIVLSCQKPIPTFQEPPFPGKRVPIIPKVPPVYMPPYPWQQPGEPFPEPPVPWPMDPWIIGQQPGVKPWDPWNSYPPAAAPTTQPKPYDGPLSWLPPPPPPPPPPFPHPPYYPHHKYPPYYPHHHYPYWLYPQMPTLDSQSITPYGPVPQPPFSDGQSKGFPELTESS